MSAYICTPEHIGLLAAIAAEATPGVRGTAANIARRLARENILSVAYRYPYDKGNGDRPGPCLTDAQIIKASMLYAEHYMGNLPGLPASSIVNMARCLDYQSCERPGWEGSIARKIVDTIERYGNRLAATTDHRPATVKWEFTLPEHEMLPEVLKMFEPAMPEEKQP